MKITLSAYFAQRGFTDESRTIQDTGNSLAGLPMFDKELK